MIHKDEFVDWKNHPVTEEFFKEIAEVVTQFEEAHFAGMHLDSHARLAEQLGMIQAYRSVVEYSPEFNSDGYMIDNTGEVVE